MKKSSILFFSIMCSIFLVYSFNVQAASDQNQVKTSNQIQEREHVEDGNANNEVEKANEENTGNEERNWEQEQAREQVLNQEENKNQNQEQVKPGNINSEEHRSTVSNSVQNMLRVADQEVGEIGQRIRVIVQEQNESINTTIQAMEKVQTRSLIQKFFFGSDYNNLNTLKNEMNQTQERLNQLNDLVEDIQDEVDKEEIQNQIQVLEQEKTKIENFVQVQENTFSLFGWLTRLFNR